MLQMKALAARTAVCIVAVGTLAGGVSAIAAGSAVASSPVHGSQGQGSGDQSHGSQGQGSGDQWQWSDDDSGSNGRQQANHARACQRLQRYDAFATRNQARFEAHTARFAALEAKAQKNGNTELAKYWGSVVSHRDATLVRMQAALAARLKHGVGQYHGRDDSHHPVTHTC